MTPEGFLQKWSAVIYEPSPICGDRYAMEPDLKALLATEKDCLKLKITEAVKLLEDLQEDARQLAGWLKGHKGEPLALGIVHVATAALMGLKEEK